MFLNKSIFDILYENLLLFIVLNINIKLKWGNNIVIFY